MAASGPKSEAGAPGDKIGGLRWEIRQFMAWLEAKHQIGLCSVGYAGRLYEVWLRDDLLDEYFDR